MDDDHDKLKITTAAAFTGLGAVATVMNYNRVKARQKDGEPKTEQEKEASSMDKLRLWAAGILTVCAGLYAAKKGYDYYNR